MDKYKKHVPDGVEDCLPAECFIKRNMEAELRRRQRDGKPAGGIARQAPRRLPEDEVAGGWVTKPAKA